MNPPPLMYPALEEHEVLAVNRPSSYIPPLWALARGALRAMIACLSRNGSPCCERNHVITVT
ncbi:hypothetical protein FRAHR75_760025 [Frankia sp. Hr75.2]|nr:hypothetical protein FRAHR75_760025 [Frankia sp. Hr75.2]SQD99922.1 hypothetical protein FMEAI12_5890013 [Parafrankia sp. Ea1.12]